MSNNELLKSKTKKDYKGFALLEKAFDVVELDLSNKKYNLLVCKDKVKRANCKIDYEVWLNLKIRKNPDSLAKRFSQSDNQLIEGCIEKVLEWLPTLKKSLKEEPVVTSLFETEAKIEFLIEPESPSDGSDSNWSSYFNKCEKVRRTNLMKQYTFMELFDFQGYWSYRDINYNALAPSKEELLQIIKKGILKYKDKPGRYSDVWFDNDRKAYLDEDIALSDYELYNRVFRAFRFFVMPYTSFGHVSYDASYSASYHNDYTSYRFYFDYGKLNGDSFSSRGTLEFDFFEPKFVQWLREVFKIKQTDYISEEKAMKIGLAHFLDMCNINIEDLKFKDYKDFEDFMLSNMENHNYHGSSCSFLDGYGYNITFQGKKFTFILKHEVKFRNAMNLHIPEEFEDDYDMALCILENKDVLKKIFELLNTPPYRQETLF